MRLSLRIFVLAAVTIVVTACAGVASPSVAPQPLDLPYTDGSGTFDISIPADWDVQSFGEGEYSLLFATPAEVALPDPAHADALDVPAFMVMLLSSTDQDPAQALSVDIAADAPEQQSEIVLGTVGGYPEAEAILEWRTEGGESIRELRAVVVLDSKEMRIRAVAPSAEWDAREPAFRSILGSIQVR